MLRRNTTDAAMSSGSPAGAPRLGLMIGTALASAALASCTASAPPAETSFAKAQAALAKGKSDHAIGHAESAVLASPRSASYRALLGAAYLDVGRFEAAATSFDDALALGETDPRTVLSAALAHMALGDNAAAIDLLSRFEGVIPPADLGLAVALAGEPQRGVHLLINTVRSGQGGAKARQNLAYAYALAGNWRAARVMAAEDVPADQLNARISNWAATIAPEDHRVRVATLLNVAPGDVGELPAHLALSNFPSQDMMVAEAQEMRAAEVNADLAAIPEESAEPSETEALAFGRDVPALSRESASTETVDPDTGAPASAPAPRTARAVPSEAAPAAPRFVSNAVVQDVPVRAARPAAPASQAATSTSTQAKAASQRRAAIASGSAATHLVQLGSYDDRAVAREKWSQFTARFPELAGRDPVITKAVVNGRTYFRLAASGFGRRSANAMCATVKASGRGCFAYAASNPPAGAIGAVQVAARD